MPASNANEMDRNDPLARFRAHFGPIERDLIYLDGNSLGRMPKLSAKLAEKVVKEEWGGRMVRAWGEGWYDLPERLGAKIAELIGARPDEVLVSDSTTVNLFKLVVAVLRSRPGRPEVVTDDLNFPSDLYCLESALRTTGTGGTLKVIRSEDKVTIRAEQVSDALSKKTALYATSHVSFKSAFMPDMKAQSAMAHGVGALCLWDLSHAVGAVPVKLNEWGADLAVGCTYKYLNGGPGAPAFLYVRRELQEELECPIWGWFGHHDPFTFALEFAPRPQARKFLVGTPPIVSSALIEPGVDMVIEAGIEEIRAKSVLQTEFLIDLWRKQLAPLHVDLNSPADPNIRGSHISFGHPEALRIDKALIDEMKVIPDFRAPDNIRFGASPLYTTFSELEEGVLRFKRVIQKRLYERYSGSAMTVT